MSGADLVNQPGFAIRSVPKSFNWILIISIACFVVSLLAVIAMMIAMAMGVIRLPDFTGAQATAFFGCLGVLFTSIVTLAVAMVKKLA